MTKLATLDQAFHQPVRTRLAALLYQEPKSFSQLKAELEITDGNLDAHLRKLSGAGYLHSEMVVEGRPHTVYELSASGTAAFKLYIEALTQIIQLTTQSK